MSDIQALLEAAGVLADELGRLRHRFEALALAYGRDWANREIGGYPPGSVVPRYRQVACATWGEFVGLAGATEIVPLPTRHLSRGDRTVIRSGTEDLSALTGSDGFRLEDGVFLRDIDRQQHTLYLRGMPAKRAGWRLLRAWESVPLANLFEMLRDIGEYGRAMHEEAVRRERAGSRS